mgnify:CR=1 FL=1
MVLRKGEIPQLVRDSGIAMSKAEYVGLEDVLEFMFKNNEMSEREAEAHVEFESDREVSEE